MAQRDLGVAKLLDAEDIIDMKRCVNTLFNTLFRGVNGLLDAEDIIDMKRCVHINLLIGYFEVLIRYFGSGGL